MTAASALDRWPAELALEIVHRQGRNVALPRFRRGPLAFQRSFVAADGSCHAYVLHPPGGIAGGDSLHLRVDAESGSRGVVTTPAAQKFYRSNGSSALATQNISVAADACLDFLPTESILFDGADVCLDTTLDLRGSSRCALWDLVTLGRHFSGEAFASGSLHQKLRVSIDDRLVLFDRLRFDADDAFTSARWGLGGFRAWGSLIIYPADQDDVARIRALVEEDGRCESGASLLDDLLIVRARSHQIRFVAELFTAIRTTSFRGTASGLWVSPRIWNT